MLDHNPRHPAKALLAAIAISTIGITTSAARASERGEAQNLPASEAPLSIAACQVIPTYATVAAGEGGVTNALTSTNLRIAFLNRSMQPITEFTFVLSTPEGKVAITDRGWFSSGVPIEHVLGPYGALSGDATCELTSVRFKDESVWERG
jgi:hypothetical protein